MNARLRLKRSSLAMSNLAPVTLAAVHRGGQLRTCVELAALNLDELGDRLAADAPEVGADRFALSLEAQPAPTLLVSRDAQIGDVALCLLDHGMPRKQLLLKCLTLVRQFNTTNLWALAQGRHHISGCRCPFL